MEISAIRIVLEVLLQELNHSKSISLIKYLKKNPNVSKDFKLSGINIEKFQCGVTALRQKLEEECKEPDNIKNVIFEALVIIFYHTSNHQRFCELPILLELFYNKLVQKLLQLKQPSLIITNEEYNEVVNRLFPIVKLVILQKRLTATSSTKDEIEDAIINLNEAILHPKVSREICYEIIRNKLGTSGVEVVNYEVISVNEKLGFLADYYKLVVQVKQNRVQNAHRFFIKALPLEHEELRKSIAINSFKKEKTFYVEFMSYLKELGFDAVTNFLPRCHCYASDFMVFDDVSEIYANIDMSTALNYEQLSSIFSRIAKLNAGSILFEEKLSQIFEKKIRLNEYYGDMLVETYSNKGNVLLDCGLKTAYHIFEKYPEIFENNTIGNFKEQVANSLNDYYEQVKPSKVYRNFISHGDLWINNVLFKKDSTDCLLVDYQLIRYCTPVLDLIFILYLNSDKKTRDKCATKLLDNYYSNLKLNLVKHGIDIDHIYSYVDFKKSVQEYKPAAIITALFYSQAILLPKEKSQYIFEDPELMQDFLSGNRARFIDKFWNDMDTSRFRDIVEELYNLLNKSN